MEVDVTEGEVAFALVLVLVCDRRARMKDSGADQATGICKVLVDWLQTTHTHTHTHNTHGQIASTCMLVCVVLVCHI